MTLLIETLSLYILQTEHNWDFVAIQTEHNWDFVAIYIQTECNWDFIAICITDRINETFILCMLFIITPKFELKDYENEKIDINSLSLIFYNFFPCSLLLFSFFFLSLFISPSKNHTPSIRPSYNKIHVCITKEL